MLRDGTRKRAVPDTISSSLVDILPRYFSTNAGVRKAATRTHYQRSIEQFSRHLGHAATLTDLTDDNLVGFMIATVQSGLCEVTANQRAKQLRALWTWCAKRRLVDQWPTFREIAEPEPMPVAWTDEELHKLFSGCAKQTGWIGPHQACDWWAAFHWWMFDTGERTDATLHLRREWIDLERAIARVPAVARKGGRKGQVYRLSPRTIELFRRLFVVPTPTGLVFDRNWNDFYKRYRRLLSSCGLPYVPRKSGPQKMRCTVFTLIEASGGNATEFARHSSRRVTDAYLDRAILLAQKRGSWPPQGYNPEQKSTSWRNLWGLIG